MGGLVKPITQGIGSLLLKSPSMPMLPPAAPPAPTMANTDTDVAAQDLQRRLAGGRTSTMLTGGAGLSDTGVTSTSKLLGG